MSKIANFFQESITEMKKVIWPSRRETTSHTLLVIGISLGIAVFVGIIDYALTYGIEFLIK